MKVQNHTRFPAEITVATDKTGAQSYLLVVKGTFEIGADGTTPRARDQVPFFYADQHHGDPATTSIRYESEFAPRKPRADVVVVGSAHAPGGRARRSLVVELRVGALRKRLRVTGDRVWRSALGLWAFPSRAKPLARMPIVYERA
ncbi:MAG TPA: DUF2169 domain-containing protein, partial [Myxococcota bacterium]|nr:DUF2169 domain-containing protein [Myxococcota bacterium]